MNAHYEKLSFKKGGDARNFQLNPQVIHRKEKTVLSSY